MNHQESDLENQQLQTHYFHLPGIRFHPSDFELVRFYLLDKIQGNLHPLITQLLVRDCDLFASQEPWQIWDSFSTTSPYLADTDLYFFTDLKPRSKNSTHFQRKVGSGTWHGEDGIARAHQFEVAVDKDHSFMAYRKRFTYKNKGSDQNGCWIMYEYSLPSLSNTKVLCQLRNNNNNSIKESEAESKKRKRQQIITTKQRKRVAAPSSTTKDDAFGLTTDPTSNVSEALITLDSNGTVSKGIGNEPIVLRGQKYADGPEPDPVNDDDPYSIDLEELFAGVEVYSDPGEVVQGEPVSGYDGNATYNASEGLAELNGDDPVQQKEQELPMGHANGASADHVSGDSDEVLDSREVDSWLHYGHFGNDAQGQVASGYDWDMVMPVDDTSVISNYEGFDLPLTSVSSSVDQPSPGYNSLSHSFIKAYPHCWVQEDVIRMIPSPHF